jgi:hypothetical protein
MIIEATAAWAVFPMGPFPLGPDFCLIAKSGDGNARRPEPVGAKWESVQRGWLILPASFCYDVADARAER